MQDLREDKQIYNIVTIKNIDDEDFIFAVDKEQYLIRAGETRRFTKFMARLAVKHLIDRLLIKESPDGSLLGNDKKRSDLASKIVLEEEDFQKPIVPSDREIVEQLNKVSDIDTALDKKKSKAQKRAEADAEKEDKNMLPEDKDDDPVKEEKEKFDQIEKEKKQANKLPTRDEMFEYATKTLKINPDDKINVGKKQVTIRSQWDKMSDAALYEELQMGK